MFTLLPLLVIFRDMLTKIYLIFLELWTCGIGECGPTNSKQCILIELDNQIISYLLIYY